MTDAEKFSSVQYTVFKKTLFTQYDYKPDESIKAFEEYDFTVESAPCTAIGESYSVDDDDNTIYTIEVSNKSFQFMCRKVAKMDGKEMRRLYLIGSAYDCVSRSFDYSTSPVEQYRALGESCKKENRESVQKVVDYSYLEAFHPSKYFSLLSAYSAR